MKELRAMEKMGSEEREKKLGLLFVITGPSAGAGKDTVVRKVEKRVDFARIVTYTTRKPREGEVDGDDYHFIKTRAEFERMREEGFFLETNEYEGDLYGTPKEETLEKLAGGEDIILRVDINGAKAIERLIPQSRTIFLTAPLKHLKKRMEKRGDEPSKIKDKLKDARKEMKRALEFDYLVVNKQGKLEETVDQILEIIEKEKTRDES